MKKPLVVALTVVLVTIVSLVGCGGMSGNIHFHQVGL